MANNLIIPVVGIICGVILSHRAFSKTPYTLIDATLFVVGIGLFFLNQGD